MPKQGGPYSRASTSTLGTPSPSRQIGLISLETISCIPPFSLEIKGAAAGSGRGQQSTRSQALCQPAGTRKTDRLLLCVSGKAGVSLRLPVREGRVGKGVQKGVSHSQQGRKEGAGGAAGPRRLFISWEGKKELGS